MRCHETSKLLSKHLDRELPAAQGLSLSRHLGECPACSQELNMLGLARRLAPALLAPEPSVGFHARLRRSLGGVRHATLPQLVFGISRRLIPALGAITLAIVAVFFFEPFTPPAQSEVVAYEQVFLAEDAAEQLLLLGQSEITDETVLLAIAGPESAASR